MLGPGAFGSPASLARHVGGLRARGVDAVAIELPRGPAERAAARFLEHRGAVIGGHSFGGRAASLAAAEADFPGLVLFSFPLAGRAADRTAHFPRIRCPVLLLSGDRDAMAPAEDLRAAAAVLPRGRLVLFEGAGHRLGDRLDDALDAAAAFVHSLET